MEFDCIWRESEKSGAMKSVVTDQLSTKINRVFDAIADSNLPDRPDLRESILSRAFPKSLLEHVGLPTLIERVPTIYLRAVFSAYLASHYVYSSGFDATEVAFIDCLDRYRRSPT